MYPGLLEQEDHSFSQYVPLKFGTTTAQYLDILAGDRLGSLNVSRAGVSRRDQLVVDTLQAGRTPTLILGSAGYSSASKDSIVDLANLVLSS